MKKFEFRRPSFSTGGDRGELLPELVPSTSWFKNLRSELPKEIWDIVRKHVYEQTKSKCEICHGRGQRHPVECHEVWEYDEATGIQKLIRLIALCPACHEVKHFGLAQIRGREAEAFQHLCKVNGILPDKASDIVDKAFEDWARRSGMDWKLDLSALHDLVKELDIRILKTRSKWT